MSDDFKNNVDIKHFMGEGPISPIVKNKRVYFFSFDFFIRKKFK